MFFFISKDTVGNYIEHKTVSKNECLASSREIALNMYTRAIRNFSNIEKVQNFIVK